MSLEAAPSAPQNVPPGQMPPEVPQPHFAQLHPHFQHHKFLIRRKFFKIFGAEANVFSESGELLLKCKQKAFKLKEDLTVYGDEALSQPLLRMRARQVFDIGVTFDIFDVSTGPEVKIGALRRMGMKSIARDEWQIWDLNDQPIGIIQEDSLLTALLRRFVDFVSLFVPQQYNFTINGHPVGFMKQNFNPFLMKLTADFSQDTHGWLDRRLGAAAATLLCLIEGKQG